MFNAFPLTVKVGQLTQLASGLKAGTLDQLRRGEVGSVLNIKGVDQLNSLQRLIFQHLFCGE